MKRGRFHTMRRSRRQSFSLKKGCKMVAPLQNHSRARRALPTFPISSVPSASFLLLLFAIYLTTDFVVFQVTDSFL